MTVKGHKYTFLKGAQNEAYMHEQRSNDNDKHSTHSDSVIAETARWLGCLEGEHD